MADYLEHSQRWQQHRQPSTPPYHWGRPNADGIRPHHYGTADPDKCPFCSPDLDDSDCVFGPADGGGPDAA